MTCDPDGTSYDAEPADNAPYAARRRAIVYNGPFRPDRRDPNAPIIALINSGNASCATAADPDAWFATVGVSASNESVVQRICQHCPLRQPCLDYALENNVIGVWGGTNGAQRARIRADRRIKAQSVQAAEWLGGA